MLFNRPLFSLTGVGHVINIGSVAAHDVYPSGNVYCATKSAVLALSKGMRIDLLDTPVRVTNLDPGMVRTEFGIVRYHGNEERAESTYNGVDPLTPEAVADVIFFCATRPPNMNVNDIIVTASAQASSTVIYRAKGRSDG